MKRILEIELRSDLCAGTGKHYAAVIDLDTALDEYGIPFIPAKRIKGCMREIAEQILKLDAALIGDFFGERGSRKPGSLRLTDARIRHYDDQLDEIQAAVFEGSIRANDITELFCSVRAETSIENDTAKEGSLRFTRVVNRLSPIDRLPLKFYAEIEADNAYEETVVSLCKGLKNIGYKRNRGLGLIKCTLLPADPPFALAPMTFEEEARYRLSYLLNLNGDVMLPAADANHSLDYIPGTAALGAFAAKYLKQYGEDGFNELFFSGNVSFGNLYISDRDGSDFVPAPGFLAKIKAAKDDEKGIHNMIARAAADDQKESRPQYKPLKKGYICEAGGYKEPKTEIVYHNALNTEESKENNGGLYTQYCISSGQYFKGVITADGQSMQKLYPLLEDGVLCFGRSKTAQYSRCTIREAKDVAVQKLGESTVRLKTGDTAAFVLESDAALVKAGRYTVSLEDLCGTLNERVGNLIVTESSLSRFTNISARVISGYNAKWNLKKTQFPVIKAGSAVVFQVSGELTVPEFFTLGEKRNEGYGRVRLIPDAKRYLSSGTRNAAQTPSTAPEAPLTGAKSELLQAVRRQKELDGVIADAIDDAGAVAKKLNPSQIGRLMLMCKESKSRGDLQARIDSIKTVATRKCASDALLRATEAYDWEKARKYIFILLTTAKYRLKAKEGK